MKKIKILMIAAGLGAVTGMIGPSQAADPVRLKSAAQWHAFGNKHKKASYCYAVSRPTKSAGNYKKRDDTFITITHIGRDKSYDVVRFDAGYTYKKGSEVNVTIAGKTFKMFTRGMYAWARDVKSDKAIVAAMRGGQTMIVRGVSSRGTKTTDTYSLNGISAAHNAINAACEAK